MYYTLITCGEGVEDILIYLMEFSSPFSDLCKYFDPHSRISEETPIVLLLKCFYFLFPLPLSVQNFGPPPRCLPTPPLEELMTGPSECSALLLKKLRKFSTGFSVLRKLISYTLFYKEPLYKEPTCRMPEYYRTYTTRRKFPKELFNLRNFYNSKQSRIRRLVPFICYQNLHRFLARFVPSVECFTGLKL